MPEQPHPYDGVAQMLFDWMEEQATWATEALRGGYRAPFGADVSEREKLDYYRRQMFVAGPDGQIRYDQPNGEGRSKLMQQLGPDGYAQVYNAVKPQQGRRPSLAEPEEEPDDTDQDQPPVVAGGYPGQTGGGV